MKRWSVGVIAAIAALGLSACGGGPSAGDSVGPSRGEPSSSSAAQSVRFVDVGGRSLELACAGAGTPTVLLEAGLGGDHHTWDSVMPALAERTRVCAYDRANVGGSDAAATPRSAADMVADLHTMLDRAGEQPPYLVVGFSFGGIVTQLYASTYPDEIGGLVLVESNNADENDEFDAHLSPAQVARDRRDMKGNPEGVDIIASFEQAQRAPSVPDVPLVVVTAGRPTDWPPGWDSDLFDRLRARQQRALVGLVSEGTQLIARSSGHEVPTDQPTIVIKAVAAVLRQIS